MRFDAQDDKTPIERALAKGGDVHGAMMGVFAARGDLATLKKAIEGGGDPKALDEVRVRLQVDRVEGWRGRGGDMNFTHFLSSIDRLAASPHLVCFRFVFASKSLGREPLTLLRAKSVKQREKHLKQNDQPPPPNSPSPLSYRR